MIGCSIVIFFPVIGAIIGAQWEGLGRESGFGQIHRWQLRRSISGSQCKNCIFFLTLHFCLSFSVELSWEYIVFPRILPRKNLVSNWFLMLILSPKSCILHWKEIQYNKPVSTVLVLQTEESVVWVPVKLIFRIGDFNQVLLLITWRILLENLMMGHSFLVNLAG